MSATLHDEATAPRRRETDAVEDDSVATTLLAFAVAVLLLLVVILGLWSAESPRAGCVGGAGGCEAPTQLVPVRSR
jgi:hypothetical protein